ncbi:hypothetical protein PMIN03_012856 [Paraphaeosphaeria minitans]
MEEIDQKDGSGSDFKKSRAINITFATNIKSTYLAVAIERVYTPNRLTDTIRHVATIPYNCLTLRDLPNHMES